MSGADLFVVCKSCGSEVSPYITECPYCGSRLRKRAPKLDGGAPKPKRRRRAARPSLGRLRPGEMPGIRLDSRPYATVALLLATLGVGLAWQANVLSLSRITVVGPLETEWWRVLTAPFAYANSGYLLCAGLGIAVFGWLLERRHGPWAPVLVFVAGGAGGMFLAATLESAPLAGGGNGAALAMLCAWVVPDLMQRRANRETDSDLIGVAVIAGVLALLPLAVAGKAFPFEPGADWIAGFGGAAIGLGLGFVLAALRRA